MKHPLLSVLLSLVPMYTLLLLSTLIVSGQYTFYGNEIKERGGLAVANDTRAQRCWIDDFQKVSQPGWGFLKCYRLFISSNLPSAGPPLRVQIWTNTSSINQFVLKWEKRFTNYITGRAYDICVEDKEVVEVTEFDRIGFTNEGIIMPVSYNYEIDDTETRSTAHRTYWIFLELWNNPIPKVGDTIMADNNALRAIFSIGVNLTSTPPLESGLVYTGYDLKARGTTEGTAGTDPTSGVLAYVDTKPLAKGRLKRFMYKLDAFNQQIELYLFVLIPTSNYKSATVEYVTKVTHQPGPAKTYTVELDRTGPLVNDSFRFGWLFVGQNPLFRSFETGSKTYNAKLSASQLPLASNVVFAPDSLSRPYSYSIGVVIDPTDQSGEPEQPSRTEKPGGQSSGCQRSSASSSVLALFVFAFIIGWC